MQPILAIRTRDPNSGRSVVVEAGGNRVMSSLFRRIFKEVEFTNYDNIAFFPSNDARVMRGGGVC